MRHAWWISFVLVGAACGSDDDPNCVSRASVEPAHEHDDGKGTYAGDSCVESQCHLAGALGPQAPAYHAAGTIFKNDLMTPQAGVTVRFTPLNSSDAPTTATTDSAGNFFVLASGTTPFPSIPEVTACPTVATMLEGALDPSYGSCATASCHSRDSGRGPIILED